MARTLPAILLLLSLAALSCTEETIVIPPEALVDPRFMPRIAFTFPPANSVGPYASWGDPPNASYAILVRFNKLMDPRSVRSGFQISSSVRPVNFNVFEYYNDQLSDEFTFYPRDSGAYSFTPPQVGEIFTLSIAQPVSDINGNVIAPAIVGTFLPEPSFRVRRTDPPAGGLITAVQNEVSVSFNSLIDTTMRRYVSIEPATGQHWRLDPFDSTRIRMWTSYLLPSRSYVLTVAAGAHDRRGNALRAPYTVGYRSDSLFLVDAVNPTTSVPLSTVYTLHFSLILDTASMRPSVHISPAAPQALQVVGGATWMEIRPVLDYDPLTRYTITIDTTLRSVTGVPLAEPYVFTFRTTGFRVSDYGPADNSSSVSTSTGVTILFTGRIDTSTQRRAFSIDPPLTSGFFSRTVSPEEIFFYPNDTLRSFTTYTVKLDTSIRSQRGLRIPAPLTFRFTTGGNAGGTALSRGE